MGPLLLTLLMLALAMGCFWLARKAQRDVNKLVGNVEAIAAKVDAGEGTSRNFESLETRVVKPRLTAALNAVFEKFDPLVAQREKGATPVSMSVFEDNLRIELQGALPKEILVRKTMIAFVQYPPNVQKALDDMQVELANTQIALQQQETAEAQKAAIETLASAKMSPDAIVQYCLVVTERLAQAGKAISAAWNCMGTVPVTVGVTK